jgi:hypothetical protein
MAKVVFHVLVVLSLTLVQGLFAILGNEMGQGAPVPRNKEATTAGQTRIPLSMILASALDTIEKNYPDEFASLGDKAKKWKTSLKAQNLDRKALKENEKAFEDMLRNVYPTAKNRVFLDQLRVLYLLIQTPSASVLVSSVGGRPPKGKDEGAPASETTLHVEYPTKLTLPVIGPHPETEVKLTIKPIRDGMEPSDNNQWAWTRIVLEITISIGSTRPSMDLSNSRLFYGVNLGQQYNALKTDKVPIVILSRKGKATAGYWDLKQSKFIKVLKGAELPRSRSPTGR